MSLRFRAQGRAALRAAMAPLRTAGLHILRLISPRAVVEGIELVDLSTSNVTSLFYDRVGEALRLIARYAPRRLARIQRDLRRIALVAGGGEFYHSGLRAYVTDVASLRQKTAPEVATAIIHEGTHARLAHWGIGYEPAKRARIEQLCIRAELDFASRLPNSGELVRRIGGKLASPWWTDAALHRRRVQQLRSYRVPAWLVRIYERLFAPRRECWRIVVRRSGSKRRARRKLDGFISGLRDQPRDMPRLSELPWLLLM